MAVLPAPHDRRLLPLRFTAGVPLRSWVTPVLVVVLAMINFGDKAVLGLAAVPLSKDLGLSHATYGLVASSFFLLFSLSALGFGFLANRVRTKWLLLALAIVWSLAQLPLGLAASVATLFTSRIVLGAAEGPTASLAVHSIFKWFPPNRRAVPGTLYTVGAGLGVFVAAPVLTAVIGAHGWRAAFLLLAAVGAVWALLWLVVGREGPAPVEQPPTVPAEVRLLELPERVPYRRLMLSPTWLGSAVAGFGAYWAIAVGSADLPAYLVTQHGFRPAVAADAVSTYALVAMLAPLGFSVVAGRAWLRGHSSRWTRGLSQSLSVLISAAALFVLPHVGSTVALYVFAAIGFGFSAVASPLSYLTTAEITPDSQRGAMLGALIAVQTLPGLIAPTVTGWLIDAGSSDAAGYRLALTVGAAIMAACGLVALVAIRPDRDARRFGLPSLRPDRRPAGGVRHGAAGVVARGAAG